MYGVVGCVLYGVPWCGVYGVRRGSVLYGCRGACCTVCVVVRGVRCTVYGVVGSVLYGVLWCEVYGVRCTAW